MRVAEIRELQGKDTFVVKNIGLYPVVGVEPGGVPAVGLAGVRLLTETSRVTGLGNELSRALSAWRRSWAVHDPGKIILDLAVCVALGGRCLSDLSLLRCDKEVFGPVATRRSRDLWGPWPTTSRLSRPPSTGLARRCGSGCGTWPASTHQRLESALSVRW